KRRDRGLVSNRYFIRERSCTLSLGRLISRAGAYSSQNHGEFVKRFARRAPMRHNRSALEPRSRWAFVLLACAAAAACGPREKVVKIAVATPLTGDSGAEGQGIKRAVIMAVEEANASHRFPYKLAAAPFDDRADPKE